MDEVLEYVEECKVKPEMDVDDLISCYHRIHGFMAGHLVEAISILEEGVPRSRVRVLTFTGNLVATGLRGILAQLLDEGIFNVVITTAGALDHDIAKFMGARYYKGRFELDDEEVYKRGFHRLGNVLVPIEGYGPLVEKFVGQLVSKLGSGSYGVYELLRVAGEEMKEDPNSILGAAVRSGAYVFVPGWPDGAFGTALFMEAKRLGVNLTVNYFKDMEVLADIFFPRKGEALALIVGGGISKHHAIWWAQFREGLDWAVYITTAVEYDGSLSGAHPREAISWGKIKARARKVVVYGDATIMLPFIAYRLVKLKKTGKVLPPLEV